MARISVLIRNRNEGENLRRVLRRLRQQHTQPSEIVVVDNESEDDSRKYIQEFGAKLVHLPKNAFTYGKATNVGFENCSGDLVLMLSSHSIPIGNHFIDDVCEPFLDSRVAAVRIPIAANSSEIRKLDDQLPLDQNSTAEEIFRRGPVASGCVILRSAWAEHAINERLKAAEDKEWAMRVLRSGKYIMPVANAAYCYLRSFSTTAWLNKIRREEAAGLEAAGLVPRASWKDPVATLIGAQREALRKLRIESELYAFRLSLRRKIKPGGNSNRNGNR